MQEATPFNNGDLLVRSTDKKRGICLRTEASTGRVFVQLPERIVLAPASEWNLMRPGWGAGLRNEAERIQGLKGT